MPVTVIKNAAVVTVDSVLQDHAVVLEGGKILDVLPSSHTEGLSADITIDAEGNYLTPGFIDLHIHGVENFRIDAGLDDLEKICKTLPKYGVTGFLPTVCPLPVGKDAEFLAALSQIKSEGTEILAFHLEGPFLAKTGALPPEALGTADPDRVRNLIIAGEPYKVIFSISPDFDGIDKLLPIMTDGGKFSVPAFITHTSANVAQTQAAIELGARHGTHFYDVFYAPEETEPGVRPCGAVEAILTDERCSVDFILDGVHVDPVAVEMAMRCKGPDRVCLITDANVGAGLPAGTYDFCGYQIVTEGLGSPARMAENAPHPGALAGSGLTMNLAVKNATKLLSCDLPQIIRMGSTNPAKTLRIDDRKGELKKGYDADIIIMDKEFNVLRTWVAGKNVYEK